MIKGLFVCCLFLEYVSLSRRFIPELLNFLLGILYIAIPNTKSQGELIYGVFFFLTYSFWKVERALKKLSEVLDPGTNCISLSVRAQPTHGAHQFHT